MSFMKYLNFDGRDLPMPDSYSVSLRDVEADSGGETEAGTLQRDLVRLGVVCIEVSFTVTVSWLGLLTGYKQQDKIMVGYLDPGSGEIRYTEMYIDGFKARLAADSSYKGIWKVEFTLVEF